MPSLCQKINSKFTHRTRTMYAETGNDVHAEDSFRHPEAEMVSANRTESLTGSETLAGPNMAENVSRETGASFSTDSRKAPVINTRAAVPLRLPEKDEACVSSAASHPAGSLKGSEISGPKPNMKQNVLQRTGMSPTDRREVPSTSGYTNDTGYNSGETRGSPAIDPNNAKGNFQLAPDERCETRESPVINIRDAKGNFQLGPGNQTNNHTVFY